MNNNVQTMIEKYRRELMEFNKKNPARESANSPVAEAKKKVLEVAAIAEAVPAVAPPVTPVPIEDSTPYVERNATENNADGSDNNSDNARIRPQTGLVQIENEQPTPQQQPVMPIPRAIQEAPDTTTKVEDFESDAQKYPPYNEGGGGKFDGIQSFLDYNQKTGLLRVQVYAAGETFPISNAKVVVGKDFSNSTNIFYTEFTDISGVSYGMTLPAPDKNLASYPSALLPYATYDVIVEHPNFTRAIFKNCALFDGIETVQRCEMIPKAENQSEDNTITYDNTKMGG